MKARILFYAAMLASLASMAQFQWKKNVTLTDTTQNLQWVDINNDSLLDAVITFKKNNYLKLVAVSQLTTDSAKTYLLADSISSQSTPVFLDWDGDNKIDIVFSQTGSSTIIIEKNLGNFLFEKTSISIGNKSYTKIQFADLNSDGQREAIVINQSGGWSVFRNNHNQFTLTIDSSNHVDDIASFDFDGNGFRDLVTCGTLSSGQPFLTVYEFFNAFQVARKIDISNPVHGTIEIGDVNEDGFFDLLVSGKNASGYVSRVFINNDSTFTASKKTIGLQKPALRIADLNSDGLADISLFGTDSTAAQQNWLFMATGDSISLPVTHITHQAYGDYDRDGDLDLLLSTDTLSMVILENQTATKNVGPSIPTNSLSVFIFDRYFMYWNKSADDHTPSPAVSYDLALSANQKETDIGEFDFKKFDRLTVTHGNQSTNNFTLQHIPVTTYSYYIQSVDNSFTANIPLVGNGQPGQPGACTLTTNTHNLTVCNGSPIQLQSPQPAQWFSFSKGYMGQHNTLKVSQNDTVFSFLPTSNFSCSNLSIYVIQMSLQDTIRVSKNYSNCKGSSTWLTVDSEWSGVVWKNQKGNQVGTGDSLHYTLTSSDILTALGHNNYGCFLRETESITASTLVLKTNGEDFKIMLGQSVSLEASGAEEYRWQPSNGLSSTTSADPAASPSLTTLYTVAGTDSLGCTATANVLVEVTETAFIPTLFTPNGDGKNDELLIYGLTSANDFQLTIYNREGSIVFSTSDIGSASSSGWDGSKNGTPQQSGLYYWKVEGHFSNGQSLTLNGKTKGSVMLLR